MPDGCCSYEWLICGVRVLDLRYGQILEFHQVVGDWNLNRTKRTDLREIQLQVVKETSILAARKFYQKLHGVAGAIIHLKVRNKVKTTFECPAIILVGILNPIIEINV